MYPAIAAVRSGSAHFGGDCGALIAAIRFDSPMLRLATILLLAISSRVLAHQAAPPAAETADAALERLARQLSEVRGDLDADAEDSLASFDGPNETARQWLDRVAPFGAELRRIASGLRPRQLDLSQGFRLTLPHLSGLRSVSHTMGLLANDAVRRGDAATMIALLRAQRDVTMHTAGDGLTISSLVAMYQSGTARRTLAAAIDGGLLDRAAATEALAISRELGDGANYGLVQAMRSEGGALQSEISRLAALAADERVAALDEVLGGNKPQPGVDLTSDAALARAGDDTASYFRAAEEAMANPDRAAGQAALAALEESVAAGERSPFLNLLAPALLRVHDRLSSLEREYAVVNGRLEALANGTRSPTDLTNAAPHYLAAAQTMAALDNESQQQILAASLAGDELSLEDRMRARRVADALRARVIDRLLRGAACGRCEFKPDEWPTLLAQGVIGANGAARLLLAEPLVPGERRDAHTRVDGVIAVLAMSRHYASAGGFGRAIVAQELARDAAREITALGDARQLADADRARIDAMLTRFTEQDPFGFRAAAAADRTMLASDRGRFRAEAIRGLSPNALAFLVAIWTDAHAATAATPCDCPHDGPLLSIRGWFDPNALAEARRQRGVLAERPIDRPALEGLQPTTPIDIDARTTQGDAEFAQLRAAVAK